MNPKAKALNNMKPVLKVTLKPKPTLKVTPTKTEMKSVELKNVA